MDMVVNTKGDSNEDKIRTILEVLKKQIDQYDHVNESTKSKEELTRSQRIQKLMMEEKRLSTQFQQIRKEIKRYERKYEKVLKKKVKLMKIKIQEDQHKLEVIKQKYHELDTQIDITPYKVKKAKKVKSKKVGKPLKVKTMKPKFRQKNVPLSKKIKIKIKRNEKLGRREMHFVNDINGQNTFTDLVKMVNPITTNTKECRIMLQRLTKEQMSKYVNEKRLGQPQAKKKRTRDSSQKVVESKRNSHWQIKIPQSVFEEIQKEGPSLDLNIACSSKNVS